MRDYHIYAAQIVLDTLNITETTASRLADIMDISNIAAGCILSELGWSASRVGKKKIFIRDGALKYFSGTTLTIGRRFAARLLCEGVGK